MRLSPAVLLLTAGGIVPASSFSIQSRFSVSSTTFRTGLPVTNATIPYWFNFENPLANEGSDGELTQNADVCIIGSGMTGTSVAYHLSKQPTRLQVVVLEAREFCSGATGRNGGHLTPYSFKNFASNQDRYGTEEAIKSAMIENRTVNEMFGLLEREGLVDAVDLVRGGHYSLFEDFSEAEGYFKDYLAANDVEMDLNDASWLSRKSMNETYGAPYSGSSWNGNNIWPLKFVTQLFNLAKARLQSSLVLHTQSPVTSIASSTSGPYRWSLTTPRGSVDCKYVVHATNAYAGHLLPHMNGPGGILPTRGQVVAIKPAKPLPDNWYKSWGGLDMYWFPRPDEDQLVLLGGARDASETQEQPNFDDSTVHKAVGQKLREFLPFAFRNADGVFENGTEPVKEWTGIMGYTNMSDPFVGPVIDPSSPGSRETYQGQFMAAGYTGHGMPRAFSCAEAISSMILAEEQNETWNAPEWLPERYLTWNRDIDGGLLGKA